MIERRKKTGDFVLLEPSFESATSVSNSENLFLPSIAQTPPPSSPPKQQQSMRGNALTSKSNAGMLSTRVSKSLKIVREKGGVVHDDQDT
jgi:hypothetical protein